MNQMTLLPDPIDQAWLAFHHQHPEVYAQLVQIVDECRRNGARRVSLRDAFGAMRLERVRRGRDADGFVLNNNWTSRYARLIAANRPDLARLLTTRKLQS